MPVSVSVYTGHTLQWSQCSYTLDYLMYTTNYFANSNGLPRPNASVIVCRQCTPVYTASVRPLYTGHTALGSGMTSCAHFPCTLRKKKYRNDLDFPHEMIF